MCGLKILVSPVRFRPWALTNQRENGRNSSRSLSPVSPQIPAPPSAAGTAEAHGDSKAVRDAG